MIRITVELLPFGREEGKQVLGVAEIANDGTGTASNGHYRYKLSKRGGRGLWRRGTVRNFPRQKLGAWDLFFRVLYDAVASRNG